MKSPFDIKLRQKDALSRNGLLTAGKDLFIEFTLGAQV